MSNNTPPWSPCSWLYALILSLLTGVVGWGQIALCYNSFSLPVTELGIVRRFCLVAGIVMVVFVLFWIIFIFCTWRGSLFVTEECHQSKEQKIPRSSSSGATSLLGLLSLVLLTISILLELSGTGLLWWASQQLSDQYQVKGVCFCVRGAGQPGSGVRDIFSVNCPVVEGYVCEAVFRAVMVTMGSATVSTRDCQKIDGSQQDSACLEYLDFWNFFKALRIVLPVLAIVKLPVLLVNCSRWLCKVEKKSCRSNHGKFATDSISWIGLDVLISPLKLVDPVQFYSNICKPLDSQPPLGERVGPVGQEDDNEGSLPSRPTAVQTSSVIAKSVNPCSTHPSLTVVHCPIPPFDTLHEESKTSQAGIIKVDSPPDIGEHTISTPKHPRLKTPSFDLSKVVKPFFPNTSMEEEVPVTNLNLKPDVSRSSRLSSFSSTNNFKAPPPPLPKPEFHTNARHLPPPFTRSATTLPRPVRLNSADSTIPGPLSPPPTLTMQLVLDPPSESDTSGSVQSVTPIVRLQPRTSHSSKSSPIRQGPSTPIHFSSSIREISLKSRNKSSSSTVDWTKFP